MSFYPGGTPNDVRDVVTGDFNGDGRLDLLLANFDALDETTSTITLLSGIADGTFGSPVLASAPPTGPRVARGDLNGDGKLDFVSIRSSIDPTGLSVLDEADSNFYLGNGTGSFVFALKRTTPQSLAGDYALRDVNGDGRDDLVTVQRFYATPSSGPAVRIGVTLAAAGGGFAPELYYTVADAAAELYPGDVAVADFNGDGFADVAVATSRFRASLPPSTGVVLLLNDRTGAFPSATNVALPTESLGLAAADLDGDGDTDLVIGSAETAKVSVLLNNGNGTFGAPTELAVFARPGAIAIGDMNGDGRPDIVAGSGGNQGAALLLNNGAGLFQAAKTALAGNPLESIVLGDFNGDGKLDLAGSIVTKQVLVALAPIATTG